MHRSASRQPQLRAVTRASSDAFQGAKTRPGRASLQLELVDVIVAALTMDSEARRSL